MAERHFDAGGDGYARYRPDYPPSVLDLLVARCVRTEHALDVGCGTGQLSALLAERFERVTATDPSASQIAHATPRERVEYRVGAAEQIELPDESVDLVVAAQAAHWFELAAFYREARRVGRPGALLALVTYSVTKMEGDLGERLDRFYREEIHRFWPEGRMHVETGYRELAFPFDEMEIPVVANVQPLRLDSLLGYIETWSASKRARERGEGAIVDRFAEELRSIWGEPEAARPVRWEIAIRAARLG